MSTYTEHRRAEAMATLQAAVHACGDVVPYEQRDARVRLVHDPDDSARYWVDLCGRRIGWIYKAGNGRAVEWAAWLKTGGVAGHACRNDPSLRRHALADLLHEAFMVAGRGTFGGGRRA